jgi:Zn-dependent protease
MQSSSINKHLTKLEKNLLRIEEFQNKGCAVDSSLGEAYLDLKNLGAYLDQAHAKENQEVDQVLAQVSERYKTLWVKYEAMADAASMQEKGMVMASNNTLPEFFYRITRRCPTGWKLFERIAALFGIGMIAFSLISPTYYLLLGELPFLSGLDGLISGSNALVMVLGAILGLVVHESAHGVVLANNGIKIERIGAMAGSMVGGFVEAEETSFFQADPKVHMRFNAAGIGTNALLALILLVLGVVTSTPFMVLLAVGSLFFGFINSFPISPLDGGWVYEDLMKFYITGNTAKKICLSLPFLFFILWIVLFIRLALL